MVDLLDGVHTTGVRPNGDDTYQITNHVEILRDDSARYTCEVIHPASGMHPIKDWGKFSLNRLIICYTSHVKGVFHEYTVHLKNVLFT